jgi:plastocyanin
MLAPAALLGAAIAIAAGGSSWSAAAAAANVAPCSSPAPSPAPVASPHLDVAVNDHAPYYDPSLPTVRRGTTVVWRFAGTRAHHSVTDETGMGLFDSGPLPQGSACSYAFTAAGRYDYYCTLHAYMTGRVHVPVWVAPHRGTRTITYTLIWSSAPPASGSAFDVRVRRPGGTWRMLRQGTSSTSGTFAPHGGLGVYRFEARLRQVATGAASLWSDPVTITVR